MVSGTRACKRSSGVSGQFTSVSAFNGFSLGRGLSGIHTMTCQ